MPQMMPMYWTMTFILSIILWSLITIFMYFLMLPPKFIPTKYQQNLNYTWYWKW